MFYQFFSVLYGAMGLELPGHRFYVVGNVRWFFRV